MHHPIDWTGPALHTPGRPRWYGLRVAPQKERRAADFLAEHGVEAFYPITYVHRRYMGKRYKQERKYLPGYVFACFPGEPRWFTLFALPLFSDVIRGSSGMPGEIAPEGLQRLYDMRATDEAQEAASRARRTLRRGDRARVLSGPLSGSEVEMVEIRGSRGVFYLPLLGGATAEARLDDLEKMEGKV